MLKNMKEQALKSFNENTKMNGEHIIRVTNGGIPSEINWLNIKYGSLQRCRRQLFVIICAIVSIFIGVSLLIFFQKIAEGASNIEAGDCNLVTIKLKRAFFNQPTKP